jgi:hypothetical protein
MIEAHSCRYRKHLPRYFPIVCEPVLLVRDASCVSVPSLSPQPWRNEIQIAPASFTETARVQRRQVMDDKTLIVNRSDTPFGVLLEVDIDFDVADRSFSMMIRISARASRAPAQVCLPWPKASVAGQVSRFSSIGVGHECRFHGP